MARNNDPRAAISLRRFADEILKKGGMETTGFHKIFSDTRKLMEARQLNTNYPTIHLYANWLLHPELDRKQHWRVLDRLSEIFEKYWDNTDGTALNKDVAQMLNFETLREELISIFETFDIDPTLFRNQDTWIHTVQFVLQELIEHPISVGKIIFGYNGVTDYEKARELFNNRYSRVVVEFELEAQENSETGFTTVSWKARVEMPGWTTSKVNAAYLTGPLQIPIGH